MLDTCRASLVLEASSPKGHGEGELQKLQPELARFPSGPEGVGGGHEASGRSEDSWLPPSFEPGPGGSPRASLWLPGLAELPMAWGMSILRASMPFSLFRTPQELLQVPGGDSTHLAR